MKHSFERNYQTITVKLRKITGKEFERLFDQNLLNLEDGFFRINGEIVAENQECPF